jgi:hypothetical protein
MRYVEILSGKSRNPGIASDQNRTLRMTVEVGSLVGCAAEFETAMNGVIYGGSLASSGRRQKENAANGEK